MDTERSFLDGNNVVVFLNGHFVITAIVVAVVAVGAVPAVGVLDRQQVEILQAETGVLAATSH